MMLTARLDLPDDLPVAWLRNEVERYIAFGGGVTDPSTHERLATLTDSGQDEDGVVVEMDVTDDGLLRHLVERSTDGLSLGMSYERDTESRLTEIFPMGDGQAR